VGLAPPVQSSKLPRFSGDGSVATPSFSLAISLVTMVDFNTIHEFPFIISFVNPTHGCSLAKPNYIAMLVYKPKQHSRKYTDFHLYWNDWQKIQSNKSMSPNNNFAYHVLTKKKLSGLVSSNNQSMQANVEQAWKLQGLV